jgi:S-adenosylmethionine/arginine decarboxylase-like enzyme
MVLHNHMLVNGFIKNPPKDPQKMIDWLKNLVESIGMKVVLGPFASYVTKEGNRGLTTMVIIETSHISMHTWDEEDPALLQFDLYTCSTLSVENVIKKLVDDFGLFDFKTLVLERSKEFAIIPKERFKELA